MDGLGKTARFKSVKDLVIDSTNTYLYACDYGSNKIRRIDISSSSFPVLTVAFNVSGCWGISFDRSRQNLYAVASRYSVIYKMPISDPSLFPVAASASYIIAGQYS